MSAPTLNLTFHGIGEPRADIDASERDVWIDEALFHDILDDVATRPGVRVTFDDGNESDHRIALPALVERGISATFFLVVDRIGVGGYLDQRQVHDLLAAGMTIGFHGAEHRSWRSLRESELGRDIASRATLERLTGEPVRQAACPFGAYDRTVLRSLRRAGFDRVFTSDTGLARGGSWLQPRNTLRRGAGVDVVRRLAAGDGRVHETALRRAKVLVKSWR